MIKITTNTRTVDITIPTAGKRIENGIRKAWQEIGKDLRQTTRKLIRTGSRSGRTYIYKGRRHRASALGEVPANMSGGLARSISYRTRGWSSMEFGAKAFYAEYLEPKRPFISKTVHEKVRDTLRTILEYTDREIKKI